jgi:hypothetical protein
VEEIRLQDHRGGGARPIRPLLASCQVRLLLYFVLLLGQLGGASDDDDVAAVFEI